MDTMMLAWVFGVPVFLLVMVLALDRLESFVVAPSDRAAKISTLIESSDAEVLEREVSTMLAPVASPAEPRHAFPGGAEATA